MRLIGCHEGAARYSGIGENHGSMHYQWHDSSPLIPRKSFFSDPYQST